MKLKKNYMKLISGVMIGDSNYICTILNGLIQEVKLKGRKPIQFLQTNFTEIKVIERLVGLAIQPSKN